MPKVVTSAPDEPLDVLVRRGAGSERDGNVEAVLDANPGLALLGPILPAVLKVTIPDGLVPTPTKPKTTLW